MRRFAGPKCSLLMREVGGNQLAELFGGLCWPLSGGDQGGGGGGQGECSQRQEGAWGMLDPFCAQTLLVSASLGVIWRASQLYFTHPMCYTVPRTPHRISHFILTTIAEVNTVIVPILQKRKWAQRSLG